jgi:glycosyltransferase involved in cell wall biosynthesis
MELTVLNVAFPFAPVAPDVAGGAEQILLALDQALVRAGHKSLVLAPPGSRVSGRLLSAPPVPRAITEPSRAAAHARYAEILDEAAGGNVDVIHLHGLDFLDYLPRAGPPVVITLHLPPQLYPRRAFSMERPCTHLVCVSESQARACPAGGQLPTVIQNGVCLASFYPDASKEDYVVALGRICPEKGFHLALDAATSAGMPLMLAGETFAYPAHEQYFREAIQPRLRTPHRLIGRVGGAAKRTLLAHARALLITSQIAETSSLVAMEALACGTPVIAFGAGALPAIVDHGRTGFLVNSVGEMADAILRVGTLDPGACRSIAEQRFSVDSMTEGYLDLYRSVLSASSFYHVR